MQFVCVCARQSSRDRLFFLCQEFGQSTQQGMVVGLVEVEIKLVLRFIRSFNFAYKICEGIYETD